jgi:hypothetical protein
MFRALLVHLQEVLHKRHLVSCGRVMSVGSTRIGVELLLYFNPGAAPPEDEQEMLETRRGH